MHLLARPYQQIRGKELASVESTSYKARDGLDIPAFVTQPHGVEPKLLPLVVMPHGGPFARDEWSYDPWAQFLANRGYVVLQPNFRGSTGYGRSFVEKGVGQWGRTMQDDLDDGVKWLVEQGKVDPKRVCIMGASYGGYAAMWAAARNPDIYRCAISFAGISDLAAMIRYDRKAFSAARYHRAWREKVQGEKSFDLDTVSPLYTASQISIPLLIAHGDKDENVPVSQSKKLHEALKKANKPHEFIVFEGEGHGLQSPENAVGFLKRVEDFLRLHNRAEL
jgi:dipeptidyl aminopeptidase/acylaminoacyl peptidase